MSRKSTGDFDEMLIVAISVVGLTYFVDVTVIVVSTTPLRSHAASAPGSKPVPVIVTVSPTWPCLPNEGLVDVTVRPVAALAFAASGPEGRLMPEGSVAVSQ